MREYVPILKAKQGELWALRAMPAPVRSRVTPLLELVCPPWDAEAEVFKKGLDDHLASVAQQIGVAWPMGRDLWVDTLWLDTEYDTSDSRSCIERFCELARPHSRVVPVAGLARTEAHVAGVAAAHARDGRGAVLRLELEDFELDGAISDSIDRWLVEVGASPESVDLVLDLAAITGEVAAALRLSLSALMAEIPHMERWRSFVLAAGAFPESLAVPLVMPHSLERLRRHDLVLWERTQTMNLSRRPVFGDYAISHPVPPDPRLDPRRMTMTAAVRYCHERDWLIAKEGLLSKKETFQQFRAASAAIMKAPEWCGGDHCDGCRAIEKCADGEGGTGNQSTWRRVGTEHHIAQTVRQLSSRP